MRAARFDAASRALTVTDVAVPEPGPTEVLVRVEACGICYSDAFVKDGTFPGIRYPAVPGHEVAGRIDAVGPGVAPWTAGRRSPA